LVAFVDMKVDELLKDDKTFSKSTLAPAHLMHFWCTTEKSFNDGTRERVTLSLWYKQSATRDIESEMLGGLDAGYPPFPASIVVEVCDLIRVHLCFAKISVYDTSLANRRPATSH
jgi:hypothetical protein